MLALIKCKLLRLLVLLAERSAHRLSPGPGNSLGTLAADKSCCWNVTLHPQVLLNQSCHHPAGALLPGELPKRNIASTTQPVGAPSCSCLSLPKTKDRESLETHLLQLLFGSVLPTGYSRGGEPHSSSSLLLRRGMNNGNSSAKHHRGPKCTTQALQAGKRQPIQPDSVSTAILTTSWSLQAPSCPTADDAPLAHFSLQPPINLKPLSKAIIWGKIWIWVIMVNSK